jgi:DnaJ-class molecular chaperone
MDGQAHGTDPYATLGVKRTATDAEIRKAYRAHAKKLHPDINPGDAANEEKFKAIASAYDFLRDPERRRRFDVGEIDATGAERPPRGFYSQHAETGPGRRYDRGAEFEDLSDIFAQAFGGGRGGEFRFRGADVRYHLEISFLDAVNGTRRRVTTPDGESLDIAIPAGIESGQVLRLAGKGQPGVNDGPPGDALIAISVSPHPVFERIGNDIVIEIPVSLDEAVLGAMIEAPTIAGRVKLRIPPGTDSGKQLRLKGKGVRTGHAAPGDQLVRLRVVMPATVDPDLKEALESWRAKHPQDVRATWKGRTA